MLKYIYENIFLCMRYIFKIDNFDNYVDKDELYIELLNDFI